MGDITRPNRPVPTTARRTPPTPPVAPAVPPVVIMAGMPPVPPPPAGTSQTIVYVNAPQAAPALEPRRQVEFVPVRRKPARQVGFLAVMSILIGGIAALAAFRTEVVGFSPVIAATGFCAALVALFKSAFMTRTTFRAPLLGLLVSFAAYVIAANNTHRLQGQYDHLRLWTCNRLPALSLTRFEPKAPVPAPATAPEVTEPAKPKTIVPITPGVATTPAQSPESTPPSEPARPTPGRKNLSFIDPDSGGWITPGENKPATPSPTPSAVPVTPTVDLPTAEQHLATARAAAASRMSINYAAAKSAADAASAAYDTAGQTYAPGSTELTAASQAKIDAKSRLAQIQSQLDTDPAVAAAEKEVRAAKGR